MLPVTARFIVTFANTLLTVAALPIAASLALQSARSRASITRSVEPSICLSWMSPQSLMLAGVCIYETSWLVADNLIAGRDASQRVLGHNAMLLNMVMVAALVPVLSITVVERVRSAAVAAAAARLEATSAYLRSFVGHVSHEARVPLQAAQLALEEIAEDIETIAREVGAAPSLTEVASNQLKPPRDGGEAPRAGQASTSLRESASAATTTSRPTSPGLEHTGLAAIRNRCCALLESSGILRIGLHASEEVLAQMLRLQEAERLGSHSLQPSWYPVLGVFTKLQQLFAKIKDNDDPAPQPIFHVGLGVEDVIAFIDDDALRTILAHLIANAIKFHDPYCGTDSCSTAIGCTIDAAGTMPSNQAVKDPWSISVRAVVMTLRGKTMAAVDSTGMLWPPPPARDDATYGQQVEESVEFAMPQSNKRFESPTRPPLHQACHYASCQASHSTRPATIGLPDVPNARESNAEPEADTCRTDTEISFRAALALAGSTLHSASCGKQYGSSPGQSSVAAASLTCRSASAQLSNSNSRRSNASGLDVTADYSRACQRRAPQATQRFETSGTGRLRKQMRQVRKLLLVEVEDRGPGIPETERKDLFKPFVQMKAGQSRKGLGTGVSLAMCSSLARAMGATIGFREPITKQSGSVFFLALPFVSAQPRAAVRRELLQASSHSGRAPRSARVGVHVDCGLEHAKPTSGILRVLPNPVQPVGEGGCHVVQAAESVRPKPGCCVQKLQRRNMSMHSFRMQMASTRRLLPPVAARSTTERVAQFTGPSNARVFLADAKADPVLYTAPRAAFQELAAHAVTLASASAQTLPSSHHSLFASPLRCASTEADSQPNEACQAGPRQNPHNLLTTTVIQPICILQGPETPRSVSSPTGPGSRHDRGRRQFGKEFDNESARAADGGWRKAFFQSTICEGSSSPKAHRSSSSDGASTSSPSATGAAVASRQLPGSDNREPRFSCSPVPSPKSGPLLPQGVVAFNTADSSPGLTRAPTLPPVGRPTVSTCGSSKDAALPSQSRVLHCSPGHPAALGRGLIPTELKSWDSLDREGHAPRSDPNDPPLPAILPLAPARPCSNDVLDSSAEDEPAVNLPPLCAKKLSQDARRIRRAMRRQTRPPKPAADVLCQVLVVEDVEMTRTMLCRAMKRLGAVVHEACDGAHALDVLKGLAESSKGQDGCARCPTGVVLVLLDKDMPVCGFTFLDNLSKLRASQDPIERAMATVRVVGCTGHAIGPTIQGFKSRGAVEVLIKPAERADLKRVLCEALAAAGLPPLV